MSLSSHRAHIRHLNALSDAELLPTLIKDLGLDDATRQRAETQSLAWVDHLRHGAKPTVVETFFAEFGLSNNEGLALMQLSEALLRVPDDETANELIEDHLERGAWAGHIGSASSVMVKAASLGLATSKSLLDGPTSALTRPFVREATTRAIGILGEQFVCGKSIEHGLKRSKRSAYDGCAFSFDMLGEAAQTVADVEDYFTAYRDAIEALAGQDEPGASAQARSGISVKLSALHPRYEEPQRERVLEELVPRVTKLVLAAKALNIGLTIDAEEAARLELSLDVIEAVFANPELKDWDGFGVVVQAYSKRASGVIDWLHALAEQHQRSMPVRLVKGAYWDTEIKRAQVDGLAGFPVFTQKASTDVSYLCCARKLIDGSAWLYPQFATHNAATAAALLAMKPVAGRYEFQRLFGMGEELHELVAAETGKGCRIYAPVGNHKTLLAYLVRRLLENGANGSFVNQIRDPDTPLSEVVSDPFLAPELMQDHPDVAAPARLFGRSRDNSAGLDLYDRAVLDQLDAFVPEPSYHAAPLVCVDAPLEQAELRYSPFAPTRQIGTMVSASLETVQAACAAAQPWGASSSERARVLNAAADLYEADQATLLHLLQIEAGKTFADGIAELREAVDFLRYYAFQAGRLTDPARGIFTCIAPWNFPLAIYSGQIAAALAAGNGVMAKPAEATPLIGARAAALLHQAGVPRHALQFVIGEGRTVGVALTTHSAIDGIAFTGSTVTGQRINRAMAATLAPSAPLIAETGGLNAMIVDSTALLQQVADDVVQSAFQSAGQRCSALRILYIQDDVADAFLARLRGVMDELVLGDPGDHRTDVGPLISAQARADIQGYVDHAARHGRLLRQLDVPAQGHFVGPAVIAVDGIGDMDREVFGPVLHIARFKASELDTVIEAINGSGFGLTFGVQSRIQRRQLELADRVAAGNVYINRNQIGAVVGSQPFGGVGLSGTGPKAGGPLYLRRFVRPSGESVEPLSRMLPGPVGEENLYIQHAKGRILCLGPSDQDRKAQADSVRAVGAVPVLKGDFDDPSLEGVAFWGSAEDARTLRIALAKREGAIIPLLTEPDLSERCLEERHVCTNTAAVGGDVALMVGSDEGEARKAV